MIFQSLPHNVSLTIFFWHLHLVCTLLLRKGQVCFTVCVCVCVFVVCTCVSVAYVCIYIQSCDSELKNQGLSHLNHVTGMCVCMYSTVLCTLLYNITVEVCKLLQLVDFT